jgi:FkbM family methyltransferase
MSNTSVVTKMARLLSTPGMPAAYSKWLLASWTSKDGPVVPCSNTKISGWISFSDYWSFHRGVSPATRKLLDYSIRHSKSSRTVAVDVGAHLGLFTAELAGQGYAEIHSFEPSPRTFEKLRRNISESPSARNAVHLNSVAVGPQNGWVEFEMRSDSPGTNHMLLRGTERQGAPTVQRVPVTTLDSYCEENEVDHIDFLKIDTEGFEPFVLAGATNSLKKGRIPFLLLELCPELLRRAGTSVPELFDTLGSNGYQARELSEDGMPGKVLTIEEASKTEWADIVAVPV